LIEKGCDSSLPDDAAVPTAGLVVDDDLVGTLAEVDRPDIPLM
jgi:hypothetical protein